MKEEGSGLNICEMGETSPEYMVGKFFLERIMYLIESKHPDKVMMGRTIKKKDLNKALGRQLSISKKDIRALLKALSNRYSRVELNCHGLKIKRDRNV